MAARISTDEQHWIDGKVIQRHHRLKENTRTHGVRIEVANPGDQLHAGEFVTVEIEAGSSSAQLAVPRSAIIMVDETPTVFVAEDHGFHPQPVRVRQRRGDWAVVEHGLREGDTVVVDNVFTLKALMLKSKMGAGHAH
jgi:cobalt-zinc-cadmium efflux system membrane fusion protein